jgi:hypothetical protein
LRWRIVARGHRECLTQHLVGVAPFVVVPTHDFHEVTTDDLSEFQVNDGCRASPIMSDETTGSRETPRTPA